MASYQDYGNMLNNYYAANPYTGAIPQFDPQAEVSGYAQPAGYQAANDAYSKYRTDTGTAWLNSLPPDQRNEYNAYHQQAVDANAKKARNGAFIALGAPLLAAGAGAAFPGLFGGETAGGLGLAESGLTGASTGITTGAGLGGAAAAGGASAASSGGPWGSFLQSLTGSAGKAGGSLLSQLLTTAGNAYEGNKQAGQYGDVINTINNLYSPDSPYAKQMQQTLARKDAAAGRNSQYGSRAVELAAALTQAKSNALTSPGYGNLLGQRVTGQNIPINGLLAMLGSGAGQDLITKAGGATTDWLGKLFGNQGGSVSPTSSNGDALDNWFSGYYANGG